MSAGESKAFNMLLKGLEGHRRTLTEKRRRFTKNLVTQTNDESISGMPDVVDVAKVISQTNGAELFIDQLTNDLRSDASRLGEPKAVRNAFALVLDRVKYIGIEGGKSGSAEITAEHLHSIAEILLASSVAVALRDGDL